LQSSISYSTSSLSDSAAAPRSKHRKSDIVRGFICSGSRRRQSSCRMLQSSSRGGKTRGKTSPLTTRRCSSVSQPICLDVHVLYTSITTGRCEELNTPTLALKVFGDHSKYGMSLTLPAARHLLHSLHVNHSLQDTITAAALYRVYNLPAVSEDLISCSILTSACLKHGTRHSLRVANALVPSLQHMLSHTAPLPVSTVSLERALDKPRAWLKWTLAKIETALANQSQKQDLDWLREWRKKSGHIPDTT